MTFSGIQPNNIKQYSRWVLLLFVVSWINLVVQAPAHAAMKQQAALSSHANMAHCPETLCDMVLNLEALSSGAVHVLLDEPADFQISFITRISDTQKQTSSRQAVRYLIFNFENNRPPPLEISSTLLI